MTIDVDGDTIVVILYNMNIIFNLIIIMCTVYIIILY